MFGARQHGPGLPIRMMKIRESASPTNDKILPVIPKKNDKNFRNVLGKMIKIPWIFVIFGPLQGWGQGAEPPVSLMDYFCARVAHMLSTCVFVCLFVWFVLLNDVGTVGL
jgi:hypothetical protein